MAREAAEIFAETLHKVLHAKADALLEGVELHGIQIEDVSDPILQELEQMNYDLVRTSRDRLESLTYLQALGMGAYIGGELENAGSRALSEIRTNVERMRLRKSRQTAGEVVVERGEAEVSEQNLAVFISHSSKDAELAQALIDLLRFAVVLQADQIRCSSVDGYRLKAGVNTEQKLREEVRSASVLVGLITPSSLRSNYVMFELGARWGAGLFLVPVLAGVNARELSEPLSLLNALSLNNEQQIHQLLGDVASHLKLRCQSPASYCGALR